MIVRILLKPKNSCAKERNKKYIGRRRNILTSPTSLRKKELFFFYISFPGKFISLSINTQKTAEKLNEKKA